MKRYAVIGHPVAHSRSPALHNAWFEALGIAGHYGRVDVDPARLPDGAGLLARLHDLGLSGGNLTVPLKQRCLPALDHVDPVAVAAGAVNTVVWRDGWHGSNTDVEGFSRSATEAGVGFAGRAVILGAGGAGRAVALALRDRMEVLVLNRTAARATRLASELGVHSAPWGSAPLAGAALVVCAVSGRGNDAVRALEVPPLDPLAVWMDLNYWCDDPPHRQEMNARCVRFDCGYGMLLHQAALAFEAFTGRAPPLAIARGLLNTGEACDKITGGG